MRLFKSVHQCPVLLTSPLCLPSPVRVAVCPRGVRRAARRPRTGGRAHPAPGGRQDGGEGGRVCTHGDTRGGGGGWGWGEDEDEDGDGDEERMRMGMGMRMRMKKVGKWWWLLLRVTGDDEDEDGGYSLAYSFVRVLLRCGNNNGICSI